MCGNSSIANMTLKWEWPKLKNLKKKSIINDNNNNNNIRVIY